MCWYKLLNCFQQQVLACRGFSLASPLTSGAIQQRQRYKKIKVYLQLYCRKMGKLACRMVKTRGCYLHYNFDASQASGICIIIEKRERTRIHVSFEAPWGHLHPAVYLMCVQHSYQDSSVWLNKCRHKMWHVLNDRSGKSRKTPRVWLDTINSLIDSVLCVRMSKWERKICI